MWALIILGVVVLLLIGLYGVGMALSPRFDLVVERRINHPPEAVWGALNDYRAIPMSGRQCRGVETVSGGELPSWRENMGPSTAIIETIEVEAPRRVVRKFSDSVVPMAMQCTYTIAPAEEGTALRAAAEGAIESGNWHVPFFRFMVRVLGMARKGQSNYLEAVGKHLDRAEKC